MATVREKEVYGKCPVCGGDIVEGEKNWFCANYREKGCGIGLPKLIMGVTFNKADARLFFGGGMETGVFDGMTKDGNGVRFRLAYDGEKKEIVPRFENSGGLGGCPKCGKDVFAGTKSYFCSGYRDEPKCEFLLWKETEGAVFTPDMVKKLLSGELLKDVPCFTKEGREYAKSFRLDGNGDLHVIT